MQKAVIDRIVDNEQAVLLVGDKEIELIVPVQNLPKHATEGHWVNIYDDGKIEINKNETEKVKHRIQDKMNALKNRSKGSLFRKD